MSFLKMINTLTSQASRDSIWDDLFNNLRRGIAWGAWGHHDRVVGIRRDIKMFLNAINAHESDKGKRELLFLHIKILVDELLNPPYEDASSALRLLQVCQTIKLSERTQKEFEKMMLEFFYNKKDFNMENNENFNMPANPIFATAMMVKAIQWFPGTNKQGSTHSTQKILEWVSQTPLDASPDNLEAREKLAYWINEVAKKIVQPPFEDIDSALQLVRCCQTIDTRAFIQAYFVDFLGKLEEKLA